MDGIWAVIGGMLRAMVGAIGLILGIRDKKPRLKVETKFEHMPSGNRRSSILVTNTGSVRVKVDDVVFEVEHPAEEWRDVRPPYKSSDRGNVPFWLDPGDNAHIDLTVPLLRARLRAEGFTGKPYVRAAVVDGLGKRHKAMHFRLDLADAESTDA